jgi:hypothetical protein
MLLNPILVVNIKGEAYLCPDICEDTETLIVKTGMSRTKRDLWALYAESNLVVACGF